jgi:hypothetical protein
MLSYMNDTSSPLNAAAVAVKPRRLDAVFR